MKNSEDGSVMKEVIAGVVILAIAGVGYYFFQNGDNNIKNKTKVEIETEKLEELTVRRNAERAVVSQIQEQYSNLRNTIMKNTDIFFKDANSSNPRILLKISDKKVEAEINKRRLEITKLLEAWDKKVEDLNSTSISQKNSTTLLDLVAGAKDDVQYVKQYIKELQNIINGITPSNSQLEQSQIYAYESIIENSLSQIDQVASNVDTIEASVPAIYQALGVTVSNNTNTPPEDLPTLLTPTPTPTSSVPPIVTPSDIQNQQDILNQVQQQNNQQATTTPNPTPIPTPTPDPYVYYPVYPQYGAAQTIIEYLQSLPSPNIDRSGWPDIDTGSISPIFLDN